MNTDLANLKIERAERHASRLPWIVVAVVVVLAFVAYRLVPRRAPAVETIIVKPSINVADPPLLTATGYLVADRQAKITPKISGRVVRMNADTGMHVHRGDILAVLESTNLQAQLDEANAGLAEAQREFDRQAALWRDGVTSKSLYDSAEAQLAVARARVRQIRISMQDMVVRAPFDGTIATKNTEVGEVISSATLGQIAGTLPAGAICTVVDLQTLKVVADVNETNLARVHVGQPAEVTVDAFPGRKWGGRLTQIIPTADRAKGVVQVKVSILGDTDGLLPEMSASVSFLGAVRTIAEPPRLWIPPSAVVNGRVAVMTANGRIEWRPVATGVTRDNRVEVTRGLQPGDRIVNHYGGS
jgi:RND family efflux transporter MFP subunit